MKKVLFIAALMFLVPSSQAFAESGFGDAWFQDQPRSLGISNGYDPQMQTYTVPGNPPYTVPAKPRFQGRSAVTPRR
jgi:hypothetical protein